MECPICGSKDVAIGNSPNSNIREAFRSMMLPPVIDVINYAKHHIDGPKKRRCSNCNHEWRVE